MGTTGTGSVPFTRITHAPMPRTHHPIFNGGLGFGAERAMRQARALSQESAAVEDPGATQDADRASMADTDLVSDSENAAPPAPVVMGSRGGHRLGAVPARQRRHRKVMAFVYYRHVGSKSKRGVSHTTKFSRIRCCATTSKGSPTPPRVKWRTKMQSPIKQASSQRRKIKLRGTW